MQEVLAYILPFATAFLSFFAGKRQGKAVAQKTELENVERAIAIWRKTAESIQAQNLQLLAQNKELLIRVSKLETEIVQLKTK